MFNFFKKYYFLFLVFALLCNCQSNKKKTTEEPPKLNDFTIGIIADCQYCYCASKINRYYKKSPNKLKEAVTTFNQLNLEFTIHLGDFIDKDFSSFDTILPIWNTLKSNSYHVLGNHEFSVTDSLKRKVFEKLGLKNRYYSFEKNQWKFIVIDGNDLSFHGALDSLKQRQTDSLFAIVRNKKPYAQKYNGGLSKIQLDWIEKELIIASNNNLNVAFFCHFPVNPIETHNLWNSENFLSLIKKYACVKIFMNGHNHAGNYSKENDIHFMTFKAMVNTKDSTAFSTVTFTKDSIFINGFGREHHRKLKTK